MFGNTSVNNGGLMGSKINSHTLNCLKELEVENQKLRFQASNLKVAYKKLRDQYQGLYFQSTTYYQEAVENKEYKDQYDTLRKKFQEKEESMNRSMESKHQPMLQQGNEYRRQFPYISYPNEIPPNTEIHIKPIGLQNFKNSKNEPPKKKRRQKTSKKLIAHKYKTYCDLYNNDQNEEEERESGDGEYTMEMDNDNNRDGEHSR